MTGGESDFDIVIVGAGPAGLCFATSLRDLGLRIAVVESQALNALSDPVDDGREIALTQRSVRILRGLGIWARLPEAEVSPLRAARVLNGASRDVLKFDLPDTRRAELGFLVGNHLIRRAAYHAVAGQSGVTLLSGARVVGIDTSANHARITLGDGRSLGAPLVVAADSRFSETRRAMGIPATMQDFGKAMLVCRMNHERPHEHVAYECFDYGQTIAALPMNGNCSSLVLTLPRRDIEQLVSLEPGGFNTDLSARFQHRFGRMSLVGGRHVYPLVSVYPERFVARRYAVIGDAAVGMHPVTAHGFNFGLRGQETLAELLRDARDRHEDFGAAALLERYEREHRRATRPLYLATNAIVRLYTDDRLPARVLRDAIVRVGSRLGPVTSLLSKVLMEEGAALSMSGP